MKPYYIELENDGRSASAYYSSVIPTKGTSTQKLSDLADLVHTYSKPGIIRIE